MIILNVQGTVESVKPCLLFYLSGVAKISSQQEKVNILIYVERSPKW